MQDSEGHPQTFDPIRTYDKSDTKKNMYTWILCQIRDLIRIIL